MYEPILTPRIASRQGWRVLAHCDHCRTLKPMDLQPLARRNADFDMAEALMRGKFKCMKCGWPASGLSVSRYLPGGGRIVQVMKLTPGLSVIRHEDE